MSQIVHVVSIELVIMSFGLSLFQSRLVSGAVCSGVFEFDSNANGCNFCGVSLRLTLAELLMLLLTFGVAAGKDHKRRWSPDVASRSVDVFAWLGGSHNIRVTGYAQVASATFVYSKPYGDCPAEVTSCGTIFVSRICMKLCGSSR